MDQRQLASVLFVVIGLFIAASRLPELLLHAVMLTQWDPAAEDPASPVPQRLMSILALGASFVAVLIGSGLVLYRDRIASRLFPSTTYPLEARDLQAVAFSILGCYFVVSSVQGIMWPGPFRWAAAAQAALGVGLFFGARGLARAWSGLRSAAGTHESSRDAV